MKNLTHIIDAANPTFNNYYFKNTKIDSVEFQTTYGDAPKQETLSDLYLGTITRDELTANMYYDNGLNKTLTKTLDGTYSTWSRFFRGIMGDLLTQLDESIAEEFQEYREFKKSIFIQRFNENLESFIQRYNIPVNVNFSTKLFTSDRFITSSFYKSNQNHKLLVVRGEPQYYICAVYSCEIIYVLSAMTATLYEFGYHNIIKINFHETKSTGYEEMETTDEVYRRELAMTQEIKEKLAKQIKSVNNYCMSTMSILGAIASELDIDISNTIDIEE